MFAVLPVMLTCLVARAAAPVPYDYLGQLRKYEAEVAAAGQNDDKPAARLALNMLATHQSFVGETERAIETFHRAGYRSGAVTLSEDELRKFTADRDVHDALAAILEQTRDRQIVLINEAHHVPRDRAFATLVALELRKRGFEYLAMETLFADPPVLVARGYPIADDVDGYYTREPVFGDYLRRALAAGYVPVTYEATDYPENLSAAERLDFREEREAQNLVDRVLAKNAGARILIHVGYGHLRETPVDAGDGKTRTVMAYRLKAKTGIDPYSIDQTRALPVNFRNVAGKPFVLKLRAGAQPYSGTEAVDMYVYHPPTKIVRGRPDWLAMRGYRRPRPIPAKLLPREGRRLVQAFVEGESADAVPMDQVLVTAGKEPPVLMLPKGRYRFAVQD